MREPFVPTAILGAGWRVSATLNLLDLRSDRRSGSCREPTTAGPTHDCWAYVREQWPQTMWRCSRGRCTPHSAPRSRLGPS